MRKINTGVLTEYPELKVFRPSIKKYVPHTAVVNTDVIRVSDLVQWCRDNPQATSQDLLERIERC